MRRVEIRVLGGFEVSVGGRGVPAQAWQQRRASELVKLLALAPRHRLRREQLIDALWPDLPPDAGAANLRKAAHYARAALGSKEAVVLRGGSGQRIQFRVPDSVTQDVLLASSCHQFTVSQ